MLVLQRKIMHVLKYLTHIQSFPTHIRKKRIIYVLTMLDSDMPQRGLDDVEGTQVACLEPVLLAEALPASSYNAAVFLVCGSMNLP
jgi:hypothetical protein